MSVYDYRMECGMGSCQNARSPVADARTREQRVVAEPEGRMATNGRDVAIPALSFDRSRKGM
jgi:hypothetical protein